VTGDRDRQKNGDAGSVATVLQPMAAALQQLLCSIAATAAVLQHCSNSSCCAALQQLLQCRKLWHQGLVVVGLCSK